MNGGKACFDGNGIGPFAEIDGLLSFFHGRYVEDHLDGGLRVGDVHFLFDFFQRFVYPVQALLSAETDIQNAPGMLRNGIGHGASPDDAAVQGGSLLKICQLLDVQDFVAQFFHRRAAVFRIISCMGSHAVYVDPVPAASFSFNDDAIVHETGFHIETHDGSFGLFQEIIPRMGTAMAHFFVSCQDDADTITVITDFRQKFHGREENGDSALHIQHPGAVRFSIFHGKGALCRLSVLENRIHMTREDDKRF